jgi:hypothetical protein
VLIAGLATTESSGIPSVPFTEPWQVQNGLHSQAGGQDITRVIGPLTWGSSLLGAANAVADESVTVEASKDSNSGIAGKRFMCLLHKNDVCFE